MKLSSAVENDVTLKCSLGAVFSVDARILRFFSRALGDVHLEAITPEDCRKFCRGKGLPTRFWERKHESLRGFFRYLVSRGFLLSSPFQEPTPRIQRTFRPYICSHEELRRLLEATAQERNPSTRLEPETLRTIILLLYGAGLRVGEALRLRPCDVNFQERVLSVWNTKFFKSRLVPIGTSLASALARHAEQRKRVLPPVLRRGLKAVAAWCKEHRHDPVSEQQKALNAKLRGHYQYYGLPTNYHSLRQFYREVRRIWKAWLSRRTRGHQMSWERYNAILRKFPLSLPRITHAWVNAVSSA